MAQKFPDDELTPASKRARSPEPGPSRPPRSEFDLQERTVMAQKFPDDELTPASKRARSTDEPGPSRPPRSEFDLQESWTKFRSVLKNHMRALVHEFSHRDTISLLRQHLFAKMSCEFDYANPHSSNPDMHITDRFWKALLFRPDMAAEIAQLLRGEDFLLVPASNILQEAVDAAKWPQGLWSLDQLQLEADNRWKRLIRGLSEALAGAATYAITHMHNEGLISDEGRFEAKNSAPFSLARGQALADCLARLSRPEKAIGFFHDTNNAFLLTAMMAAVNGGWPLGDGELWGVPELPLHIIERQELFAEALGKMREAIEDTQQHWVGVFGPGGAGKTTLAIQLARKASTQSDVVWLSFRNRDEGEILEDAQRRLAEILKKKPSYCAEKFLKKHVTHENTNGVTIFIDDVWERRHLEPFRNAKTVIISSRKNMTSVLWNAHPVQVPLSLSRAESEEIFTRISGKNVQSSVIYRMLKKVSYNALATTVLASMLKDVEDDDEEELLSIERNLEEEFESLDPELGESSEFFPEQANRNLLKILKVTIDRLEDDRRRDFDRLIVFPSGFLISSKAYGKFFNSERPGKRRLDYLEKRCILDRKGESFIVHDLWADLLRQRVSVEEKRRHLLDLCDGYSKAWPQRIAWDDEFLLAHLPFRCVKVGRVELGCRLLSSGRYLIERRSRFQVRILDNFFRDLFVMRSKGMEVAVWISALSFILDSEYWDVWRFAKFDHLRLAILFFRGCLYDELLDLARAETALPLYRIDPQTETEGKISLKVISDVFCSVAVELPSRSDFELDEAETFRSASDFLVDDQPLSVPIPSAQLNSSFGIAWLPSLDDFALFFLDGEEEKILRIERPNGNVLLRRPLPGWELKKPRVSASSGRAAVWEREGRRFLLFSYEDDDTAEESALEPGEELWIRDVLPMASGAAVWLSDWSAEIWRGSSRRKFAEKVWSFVVSQCGTKLALLLWDGRLLEVKGDEEPSLRFKATCKPSDLGGLCYLHGGEILMWQLEEAILLPNDIGNVETRPLNNFPVDALKAAPTGGSCVFLLESMYCWLFDVAKEKRELIVTNTTAVKDAKFFFKNIECDPHGQRAFVQCFHDNWQPAGSFALRRLDSDVSLMSQDSQGDRQQAL